MPPKTEVVFAMLAAAGIALASPATAQNDVARGQRRANQTAASLQSPMNGSPPAAAVDPAGALTTGPDGRRCTTDGLIHAEVSAAITAEVKRIVTPADRTVAARDVARLHLPCGFRLDPRSGWNLVLTDGREYRSYRENNAFGFAPAFGFGEQTTRSYTMAYDVVPEAKLQPADCHATIERYHAALAQCAGFGSPSAFFAASADGNATEVAHYTVKGDALERDFGLARVAAPVLGMSFIAPPDAPGGTVTLLIDHRGDVDRVFLDTSRG